MPTQAINEYLQIKGTKEQIQQVLKFMDKRNIHYISFDPRLLMDIGYDMAEANYYDDEVD